MYKQFCVGLVLVSVLTLGVIGCGESVPKGSVNGKVTVSGAPVTFGSIVFMTQDKRNGAAGTLNESGEYKLSSPLPAGDYRVALVPPTYDDDPDLPHPARPVFPVPKEYQAVEVSKLTFSVKQGDNVANFDL